MHEERLRELLDVFPRLRLLIIGDFFLDQYLEVDPSLAEISLETGLVAHQVVAKRCSPGAAGTVVANLAALGVGGLYALGVIGDDGEGYELKRGLRDWGVRLDYLLESQAVLTPTYTKPLRCERSDACEMERLDAKNRRRLPPDLESAVAAGLRQAVQHVDGVIIADQVQERNCGVITDGVRSELACLAAGHPDKLFFADSRERIGEFRCIVVKPNRRELARALSLGAEEELSRQEAALLGQRLSRHTGRPVIVTLAAEGSVLCMEAAARHIPAVPVQGETDPVGAGDSATAGIVAARCAGAAWEEATFVGNLVASITVQKLGATGTASPAEVLSRLGAAAPLL